MRTEKENIMLGIGKAGEKKNHEGLISQGNAKNHLNREKTRKKKISPSRRRGGRK